ncbi:MAG: 4Fe-4S dicluster domain-containing protein [Deltaproteobacteria bacterium]|nr:4Fe-4S dicluster domain-containing protein [Deltaproteobacteria bacterium]
MLTLIDPLLIVIALVICISGLMKRARLWNLGQADPEDEQSDNRLADLITDGIFHKRILKDTLPGLMHLMMFAACLLPMLVIVVVQLNILWPGAVGGGMSLILDLIGLLGLAGVLWAAYRRYVQKADRLNDTKQEDAVALIWLGAIIVLGFCIEGLRLAITGQGAGSSPVGAAFSVIFMPFGQGLQVGLHSLLWRLHFFLVIGMIACIPFTKFRHIIISPYSMFLRKYGHPGTFSGIDFETAESYGKATLEEFTHRQLLQTDACLRCGRCQDNCPTYLSGKHLNPKKLLQDLKDHMEARAAGTVEEGAMVIGDVIDHHTIWDCTMCLNCTEHCPVYNTTTDKTIELRRYLVMTDPNFPGEAQTVFRNMENNSNPWGVGAHTRGDWAKELGVKSASDGEPFDLLLYIGCAGAFDDRYKKVASAVAQILQKAGISFAILGAEEGCCGDSARRLGNEYLYETLATTNIGVFQQYNVKKILTICPHCMNALKNEYPMYDGGTFEVQHHTEYLLDLIKQGKIKLNGGGEQMNVCYHDSCFLGRYNDIYDQPREALKAVKGISLVEMDRNLDRSFCCGAGGGRMWLEEDEGERINEMRTDMALEKSPDCIATACPYCLTMLVDGIKAREKEESVKLLDISEIILNAME